MEALGTVNGLVIDCVDPVALASFWGSVFATEVDAVEEEPARYVDLRARPGLPVLRFQRVPETKTVKNRLHLDIEVASLDEAVERIEVLGGRPLQPRDTDYGVHYRVMADPEGNEFCLIEPVAGNGDDTLGAR